MSNRPDQDTEEIPEVIDLDGIFTLFLERSGKYEARYGHLTNDLEIALRWKVHPNEGDLATAFFFLAGGILKILPKKEIPAPKTVLFGGSNILEIHQAALATKARERFLETIVEKITTAIGADLRALEEEAKAKKAKIQIERKVSRALEALASKSKRAPHKSATTVEITTESGEARTVILPWIVLQIARELAEEKLSLPTKGEIQLVVGERYPEIRGLGKTKWRNTWKQCGLSSLAQGAPWEFEERKRAPKSRAKKA